MACALILAVVAVRFAQGDGGQEAAAAEQPGEDPAPLEGRTERIAVPIDGTWLKGSVTDTGSRGPAVSADGRYVAYVSPASNLVRGDTNKRYDVFVRDRKAQTTTRVSVASDGTQANGSSLLSAMSADGRYIAYDSDASNLVPGDTNKSRDVFLWDRETGTTTRISVASDGTQANGHSGSPSISADGRYVTYGSYAWNLVPDDIDRVESRDVFVWDRETQTTTRISVAPDGTTADNNSWRSSISSDGRYVVYESHASNLVPGETRYHLNVYVWDRETGATTRVSVTPDGGPTNGDAWSPSVSSDGRYIAYESSASNLVPDDTGKRSDVVVWDRRTGVTTLISATPDGTPANGASVLPVISPDGRHIAYESYASNLVPDDTDKRDDVFVWDRLD